MRFDSKTSDILKYLHQYNFDLIVAYEDALEHITGQNLQANLTEFKFDHTGNIRNIEVYLQRNGVDVPPRTKDVNGYIYEAITTIRSLLGDRQILKTLKGLEDNLNEKFREALSDVTFKDPSLTGLLEKAVKDGLEHLDFFTNQLEADFDKQNTSMPHSTRKVS